MERYAWKAILYPGQLEEYILRHDNIWPEMKQALKEAGIRNYSIWNIGDEIFGYYECDSIEETGRAQAISAVVAQWNEYNKNIGRMETGPQMEQPMMRQVFLLE